MVICGLCTSTIHLSDGGVDRRPKLKFNVLVSLALTGKLSKSGLKDLLKDRYYADISHSVDELKEGGHIKVVGRKSGRGKEQVYYMITEKGLKALLVDKDLPAIAFWEILHGYCLNNDEIVLLDKVEELYQIVLGRYLKYYYHGFSSQLDSFHHMCNRWLEETIFKSDKITIAQKVIEVLAVNPKITLAQLLDKTGVPKSNLYQIHQLLLANSYMSMPLPYDNEQYTDFLIHNIITIKLDDGEPTYDLSLFGVILLLVLIRYNEAGKLKGGLHFKDFSVQQYYDKIALKHKAKLPLIFGKWSQLKKILKAFTAYNLDLVLDEENRSDSAESHFVNVGGNKEVYDGIRGIILYNGKLMRDFEAAGWKILKGHIEAMSGRQQSDVESPEFKKIYPLCAKFEEVIMLSRPTWYIFPNLSIIGSKTRNSSIVLGRMQNSFADEITALYYINLCNESQIRVTDSRKNDHSTMIDESFELLKSTPKECLSLILKQDKEEPLLKKWFFKWMMDLVAFQEDTLQNTKARMGRIGRTSGLLD